MLDLGLPTRLTQREFDSFVADAPIAVVRVQRRATARSFLRPVARYFVSEYPDAARVAVFDSAQVATRRWLIKRVNKPPLSAQWSVDAENGIAPEGYYLFKSGRPIAYHSGRSATLVDPVSANGWMIALDVLGETDERKARAVIDHFEGALSLLEAGPAEGLEAELRDPHQILGIAKKATKDEVKKARDRRLMEYHPDRVADMAPEIRDLATKRTQEINSAYAQIMKRHRKH